MVDTPLTREEVLKWAKPIGFVEGYKKEPSSQQKTQKLTREEVLKWAKPIGFVEGYKKEPEPLTWGETLGGGLSAFGSGLTMGFSDYIPGAKESRKNFEKHHKNLATAAEIGGMVLPMLTPVGLGAKGGLAAVRGGLTATKGAKIANFAKETVNAVGSNLGGKFSTNVTNIILGEAAKEGAKFGSRIGRGVVDGALGGSIYGFNTADGGLTRDGLQNRIGTGVSAGALGALGGGVAPVVAGGLTGLGGKIAGSFNKKVVAPTLEDLKKSASDLYEQAFASGTEFRPGVFNQFKKQIEPLLQKHGAREVGADDLYPSLSKIMNNLDLIAKKPTSLRGVDIFRQSMNDALHNPNSTNPQRHLLGKIIETYDDFIDKAPRSYLTNPATSRALETLKKGREFAHRGFKADEVAKKMQDIYTKGEAGATKNIHQAERVRINQILQTMKGLTPDEKAAMQLVAYGSKGQKVLNGLGLLSPKWLGHGAGLGYYGTASLLSGSIWPLMAGAIGYGAQGMSQAITRKNIRELQRLIALGGDKSKLYVPLNKYQNMIAGAQNPLEKLMRSYAIQAHKR